MMQSLLRSALTDDDLLGLLREFTLETLLPLVEEVAPDQPALASHPSMPGASDDAAAMGHYLASLLPE